MRSAPLYSNSLPTREEFMLLLWERICDESLSHHPSTRTYMEMLAKYHGWDDPKSQELDKDIVVRIGECEECKKAGRPTSMFSPRS